MTIEQDEQMLRKRFSAIQQLHIDKAPPFSKMWQNAVTRQVQLTHSALSWRFVPGAAALASIALLAWLYFSPPFMSELNENQFTLSEWRSPTAFLLESSGQDLFGNYGDTELVTDNLSENT